MFKPMGEQLSLKAALPLAERIATGSRRFTNTGPWHIPFRFIITRSNRTWYFINLQLQWLKQIINPSLNKQNTLHISPSRASYAVSIVRILKKIDRVIMAAHRIWLHLQPRWWCRVDGVGQWRKRFGDAMVLLWRHRNAPHTSWIQKTHDISFIKISWRADYLESLVCFPSAHIFNCKSTLTLSMLFPMI